MTSAPHSALRQGLEIAVTVCLLAACGSTAPKPVGPAWTEYRGDLARDGHPSGASLDASVASSLTLAWRAQLDGAVDGTPVIANGMVVAGSANGTLVALDAGSGHSKWAARGLGPISSSPTLGGANDIYVTTLSGHAYAFDLKGRQIWDW